MRFCRTTPSFLLSVCCYVLLSAQGQTQIEQITESDGLSYRWVLDIVQDHKGFLWFATYDGLNRYDGQHIITYRHSDSDTNTISTNAVYHVTEDNQGGIWTYGADLVFNRIDLVSGVVTKTNTYVKNGVPYTHRVPKMRYFAPLSNGDFLVLFQDNDPTNCSFWKYVPDGNYFEHVLTIPTAPVNISYFSERKDGRIWLWGLGAGYYLADLATGDVKHFAVNAIQRYSPSGVSIPVDQHHDLWYPLDSTVSSTEQLGKLHLPDDLDTDSIGYVRQDNAGGIWINYGDSTLYHVDVKTGSLGTFTDPFFGASADVRAMQRFYVDREGAFWSGHFYGAARFVNRPQLFDTYLSKPVSGPNPGLDLVSAREMIQYGKEKLIVREDRHTLFIIDLQTHQTDTLTRNPAPGVSIQPKSGIQSMLLGPDGFLWTNQGDKLVRTDPETGRYEVFDGLAYTGAEHPRIFQDGSGKIWWCSAAGIAVFDMNRKVMVPLQLDRSGGVDFAFASYDPEEDKIYGTFDRGVYIIDCPERSASRLEVFRPDEGDYRTMSILKWKGEFWLSTNKGLVRFDPVSKSRRIYSREDGLSSDIIYSALGAGTDLWLSTHNGLCQFNPASMQITIYYQEQGLPYNEFNRWSYLSTDDGRMYFGGLNGIIGFDPDDFSSHEGTPGHLNLLGVSKYNQKQDKHISVSNNPFAPPDAIVVSPYERTLTFTYILTAYQDISQNQYFHYLDGLERNWIDNGNQNEARYTQIPPGEYTFRVRATGPTGMHAINELAVPVTIMQYWYLRWWAIASYIVITGLCAVAFYRYQLSQRLERQEAKRIRELEAVKSRMYTNITHEFRTPLTVMLGMNETVKEYAAAGETEKVFQSTDMIERNARNLLDLVNQMLDLSKLESGMMEVHAEHADIISYLRYRLEAFQSYAAEKQIDITFNTEENQILMDFDPDRVSHIINNLMSNAIKFTPEGGSIVVSSAVVMQSGQRFFALKVRDTGIGIARDKINHIFERFYQADAVPLRKGEGTGIGLSLVHEMVKLLGGSITVESEPGKGSEFTVLLPVTHSGATGAPSDISTKPSQHETAVDVVTMDPGETEAHTELPLVLIVEDSDDVTHYIRICIEPDYRTVTASDGDEGIRKAIELIPDVIISDVMMPVTDGYQLCDTVKKDERTSHIPVILLTAKTDHNSKLEGLEHGADAYLAKPFDKKELRVRLRNLLLLRAEMQRHYAQMDYSRPVTGSAYPEDGFIVKVRSRILEHLQDEDFDVSTLSRLVHVSRAQLHRKLTAVTGQSTSHLIRSVQLDRAKELLHDQDLSVSEVAFRAGFKTQAHFSRVFADACGDSPSDYRRKL